MKLELGNEHKDFYEYKDYLPDGMKFIAYRETLARGQYCNPHKHDFLELVYIISGNAVHHVDDITYHMTKGDLLLIDTNQSHSFTSETGTTHANMILLPDFLSENLHSQHTAMDVFAYFLYSREFANNGTPHIPLIRFRGNDLIAADNIVSAICDEIMEEPSHFREVVSSYLNILFYLIIRNIENNNNEHIMHDIRDIVPGIIDYIERNCNEPITLNDMARRYFYSPSYFSRAFKKNFGTTFSMYLQNVRIQKVIQLMQDPTLSIEEISERIGYHDKRELYRAFKNVTGTTPSNYRKTKMSWTKMQ
ncbi:MAG: helix-turn-helix domain-containing protein [Ruminococcaceae bacterium]|nr:helix-turn-helix domain-containing protein [Oscillospiraceae bacterium]